MNTFLSSKKLLLPIAALFLLLASCNKKEETQPLGHAKFRLVNASFNAGAQDVYFNSGKISSAAIAYGEKTDYHNLNNYGSVSFYKANLSTVTATTPFGIYDGAAVTFFLNTRANGESYIWGFDDEFTAPPSGKAKVRFIHLNSFLTGKMTVKTTEGALITDSLNFNSGSVYYPVEPGTDFVIKGTGVETSVTTANINLVAGKNYSIWLSGTSIENFKYHLLPQEKQ